MSMNAWDDIVSDDDNTFGAVKLPGMTVDWSKASRSNQSRPLPPLAADDDSYLTPAVDAASVSTAFRKMGTTGKPPQTNFAFMLNKSKSNSSPPAAASSANEKAGFSLGAKSTGVKAGTVRTIEDTIVEEGADSKRGLTGFKTASRAKRTKTEKNIDKQWAGEWKFEGDWKEETANQQGSSWGFTDANGGKKQNKDRKKPLKPKRKGSAAQPQQVAEPVVEIQVEKVQEDVVAVSAPVEPVPAEPTPSISSNPAPSPTTRGNIPNASEDEWSQRIKQRLKQISIAKVSEGYFHYRRLVKRSGRRPADPGTPDADDRNCSKRQWDGRLRRWKVDLHCYDNFGPLPDPDDKEPLSPRLAELYLEKDFHSDAAVEALTFHGIPFEPPKKDSWSDESMKSNSGEGVKEETTAASSSDAVAAVADVSSSQKSEDAKMPTISEEGGDEE